MRKGVKMINSNIHREMILLENYQKKGSYPHEKTLVNYYQHFFHTGM
jgi:hypothetical protein